MCLPVRCYSCSKILGSKTIYQEINNCKTSEDFKMLFKKFCIEKYCCRSIILTSVNIFEKLNK